MSKISKFFKGGGSAARGRGGPSPQEALARLRETEEMLSKKQAYLETRIERELAAARQYGTKNKRGESARPGPGRARCPPPRRPGRALPGPWRLLRWLVRLQVPGFERLWGMGCVQNRGTRVLAGSACPTGVRWVSCFSE